MSDGDRNTGNWNTGNWNTGDRNTGNWNTGNSNTGDSNTGNSNTGDWNTSNSNTGDRNTGNSNTGNSNTGDWNTGYRNTGDRNTGNWNTGNRNTGDSNTGDWNTGYWNTGYSNTGDWNTGNSNTGDWNTGNWNTGYFCENEGPVTFFDLPCDLSREQAMVAVPYVDLPVGAVWIPRKEMTAEEVADNPHCDKLGGYLKSRVLPITEAMPQAWAKLDADTKRRFMALPNFDADKFQRITGVDVRKDADLFPAVPVPSVEVAAQRKTIVLDGVTYELVPVA